MTRKEVEVLLTFERKFILIILRMLALLPAISIVAAAYVSCASSGKQARAGWATS
jgi:hypothetical protein